MQKEPVRYITAFCSYNLHTKDLAHPCKSHSSDYTEELSSRSERHSSENVNKHITETEQVIIKRTTAASQRIAEIVYIPNPLMLIQKVTKAQSLTSPDDSSRGLHFSLLEMARSLAL